MNVSGADYERAERFLPWNVADLVSGLAVHPHWIGTSDRFWYRRTGAGLTEFISVNARTAERGPAFDHESVAEALSAILGRPVSARSLPFDAIDPSENSDQVAFHLEGSRWTYEPGSGRLSRDPFGEKDPRREVRSPDGRWVAFVADHNLRVRSTADGSERPLTLDGSRERSYGLPLPSPLPAAGLGDPGEPVISWSPDSRYLLTQQIDLAGAPTLPFLQSLPRDGSLRPIVHSVAYPLPGDTDTPVVRAVIAEVSSGRAVVAGHEPVPALYYGSPLTGSRVTWDPRGDRVHMVICDRGYQGYRLLEVLAADGATRTIADEEADDGIAPRGISWQSTDGLPDLVVSGGGRDVIWWSLRDGWPHLYLYDGETGAVRRQLTSGAWSVQDVLHVDEAARRVVFTGSGREPGRDPYLRAVYSVSLDGGDPELLTPDELDHHAWVSPTGAFFVDTASRWDQPPTTVVREISGPVVGSVEQGDASHLVATGWRPPDRICVKGRDGQTDIYGLVFRPTAPEGRRLPVVDCIYGGPQMNQAGASFADSARAVQAGGVSASFWHAQAIAELGFAVVMIDGLGMPGRSRDFQAVAWRNLADAGIPDHVAAYPQLGERYPELDIDRIGIFGHSAGGYSSAQAILRYPDVYQVCVSSAGNHDHRLDKAVWVERYMGLPVGDHYAEQANRHLADRLQGKLLLAHGDMDENVPLAGTLSLVDALIEANKDFDLLVLPNRSHRLADDPYFTRIRWDYFVRHLLGENPPAYRIKAPAPPC